MSNTGVFGLSGYNDKNLEGLIPDKTREALREYGYFGRGFSNATVNRVDYSNDTVTASQRASLSFVGGQRGQHNAASGNSNFGYFGGGETPAVYSIVQRIDYSNDNTTPSIRGPLSSSKSNVSATGTSNFGYFGGGNAPGPTIYSTIDRIDYSNDLATASVRGPLSLERQFGHAATGNSNFGYFGGSSYSVLSTVDRINYSNDTAVASVRGPLSSVRGTMSATGNSNFGYYGGGWVSISIIDRINYSNDTSVASIRGPLTLGRGVISATGNSNFGYFAAGSSSSSLTGSVTSIVERIDYSNDTTSTSTRGPLTYSTTAAAATSSSSFGGSPISQYGVFAKPFGYVGGGFLSTVDRIDYSSDTSATRTRGPLSSSRYALAATGNSNFGYFGGGESIGSTLVDRIDYLNDTSTALVRGPLSVRKGGPAATGNGNFGWFGGGYDFPNYKSGVDRINYANDLQIALQRGPLTANTYRLAATGTLNFGYFGSGLNRTTVVDRIDYSNDTATASVRGPLSGSVYRLSATGNQNFGYFGGGGSSPSPVSIVNRIDYSNDTTTASVRGPLSLAKTTLAATGNQNFGYFGGGSNPTIPASYSTIDRIDYANDTATASIRGVLSSAKSNLFGASPTAFGGATDFKPTQQFFDIQSMRRIEDTTNASVKKRVLGSYGYFGGGYIVPSVSTIDRLNFSNDTATALARAPLPAAIRPGSSSASGNNNYGYMSTGGIGDPTVYRSDYSNDTSSASIRSIIVGRQNIGVVCDFKSVYFGGGYSGNGRTSQMQRLSLENDTTTAVTKGPLSLARTYANSSNNMNSNFGYWVGGSAYQPSPAAVSTVDRLNFSNDSNTALVRGPLSSVSNVTHNVGNKNYMYCNLQNSTAVTRIDFANDTNISSNRGNRPNTSNSGTGVYTSNFGYFGGGYIVSIIDRIDFANDTATGTRVGNLSQGRGDLNGTTTAGGS